MKKTVWTFGLIAGAILSILMAATIPFVDRIGYGAGEVLGYTTMVAAFLLVFFGIRTYRDNVRGGTIGFGRAFLVGTLITCIAGLCYTATWEVMYYTVYTDFGTRFVKAAVDKARTEGKSEAEIAKTRADMEKFAESYKNPLYNSAVTFLEPLPVGLVITLVSSGVLSRRRRRSESALVTA